MKAMFTIFFWIVLISMVLLTGWAGSKESVIAGGAKLIAEPWGLATLADTYFAFLTFYMWVYYKEKSVLTRLVWFILIVGLGNMAIAAYCLLQIKKSATGRFREILFQGEDHDGGTK
jgi:hypothetical protein